MTFDLEQFESSVGLVSETTQPTPTSGFDLEKFEDNVGISFNPTEEVSAPAKKENIFDKLKSWGSKPLEVVPKQTIPSEWVYEPEKEAPKPITLREIISPTITEPIAKGWEKVKSAASKIVFPYPEEVTKAWESMGISKDKIEAGKKAYENSVKEGMGDVLVQLSWLNPAVRMGMSAPIMAEKYEKNVTEPINLFGMKVPNPYGITEEAATVGSILAFPYVVKKLGDVFNWTKEFLTRNDYYKTLGLKSGAGLDEIKTAFRDLAKQYHPDVNPGGEAKFRKVLNAYNELKNYLSTKGVTLETIIPNPQDTVAPKALAPTSEENLYQNALQRMMSREPEAYARAQEPGPFTPGLAEQKVESIARTPEGAQAFWERVRLGQDLEDLAQQQALATKEPTGLIGPGAIRLGPGAIPLGPISEESPKYYTGSKKVVSEVPAPSGRILSLGTDQHELIRTLAGQGDKTAQKLLDNPINFYTKADRIIRDSLKNEYDYVQYLNSHQPQKGQHFHDLEADIFITPNRAEAESYAKQSRGLKYDSGLAIPPAEAPVTKGIAKERLIAEARNFKSPYDFVMKYAGRHNTFQYNDQLFSLDSANEYIKNNKVEPIVVPEDVYSQKRIDEIASVGNLEGGREADLKYPAIVAISKKSDGSTAYTIIDGWNRAAKARTEGKPLLAYPVPKEEVSFNSIWNQSNAPANTPVTKGIAAETTPVRRTAEQVFEDTKKAYEAKQAQKNPFMPTKENVVIKKGQGLTESQKRFFVDRLLEERGKMTVSPLGGEGFGPGYINEKGDLARGDRSQVEIKIPNDGTFNINKTPEAIDTVLGNMKVKVEPKSVPNFFNTIKQGKVKDISGTSKELKGPYRVIDKGKTVLLQDGNKIEVKKDKLAELLKKGEFTNAPNIAAGGKTEEMRVSKSLSESRERGFIKSARKLFPDLKNSDFYIPRNTEELSIKASNLIKDNIGKAEEIAAKNNNDIAVAITAELLKHYNRVAEASPDMVVKNSMNDKAAELANSMAKRLTDIGRAAQAASILQNLTPEGQIRFAAREIQKYNSRVENSRLGKLGVVKKIPELTGEQVDKIREMIKKIDAMPDGLEKHLAHKELQEYVSDLVPTPMMRKLATLWKAGLLTGIKTSGVNMLSNMAHTTGSLVSDIPASIIDKAIGKLFTGERTLVLTTKGSISGSKEGLGKAWQYLKTGYDARNVFSKYDIQRANFGKGLLGRALNAYTEGIFRFMGAQDQISYYSEKMRSMYSQALAKAENAGLTGAEKKAFVEDLIKNPSEDMILYSSADAENAVFQNKTALGDIAKGIQRLGGGSGEFIVPFGRTPASVATEIVNYSPFGILKTAIENIGEGQFDQRMFSKGMGKSITGIGILTLGGMLMKRGMLALTRPNDERTRKLWELQGKVPGAIKLGKKWTSLATFGPLGNLLVIGGIIYDNYMKSGSPTEAMVKSLFGGWRNFFEQTFVRGIDGFLNAVSNPDTSAETVASQMVSSFIPTLVSDIARSIDDKERSSTGIMERSIARLPIARETLQPQVSSLGEERARVGSPLDVLANPFRPSPSIETPLIKELQRLSELGINASPTVLGPGKGYPEISKTENTEITKMAGSLVKSKLEGLIGMEKYQSLTDQEKGRVINNIVDKAKTYARVEFVRNKISGLPVDEQIKKLSQLKKSGLMTKEVYDLVVRGL